MAKRYGIHTVLFDCLFAKKNNDCPTYLNNLCKQMSFILIIILIIIYLPYLTALFMNYMKVPILNSAKDCSVDSHFIMCWSSGLVIIGLGTIGTILGMVFVICPIFLIGDFLMGKFRESKIKLEKEKEKETV